MIKQARRSLNRLMHRGGGPDSPETSPVDVLIIGGGNAAGYLAKELRAEQKYPGSIALVSSEPVVPYERPALTKGFLHPPGAKVRARLPGFHTCVGGGGARQMEEWYQENKIELFLNSRATKIDRKARTVTVEVRGGSVKVFKYGKLVLCTGARALTPSDIRMENAQLGNVFTIREEKEAMEMIKKLESGTVKRVVVVGGGYIGMEVAAGLCGWGLEVTLVFPDKNLLGRLFPSEIAQVFEERFEKLGIRIMKGGENLVSGLVPDDKDSNIVGGVKVKSGSVYPCEAVVFGLGARLNSSLYEPIGLKVGTKMGGLAVNDECLTSDPSIYAIGDIAALHGSSRFEHVDFARKSAAIAGQSISGALKPGFKFQYLPYFYSRLFEYSANPVIFQFYGHSENAKRVVTFGTLESASANENMPQFGAVWVDATDHVQGVLVCNGTSDHYEKAKQYALQRIPFNSFDMNE